jgi:hypothetical protein
MENKNLISFFKDDNWVYCGQNRNKKVDIGCGPIKSLTDKPSKLCQCGMIWSKTNDIWSKTNDIWSKTNDCPIAVVTIGEWGDSYPALRFVNPEGKTVDHYLLGSTIGAYTEKIVYGSINSDYSQAIAELIVKAPELLRENEELKKKVASLEKISCDSIEELTDLYNRFGAISKIINHMGTYDKTTP